MARKKVLILGATGSIGTQTIDVLSRLRDEFEIVGLSAHSNRIELERLAKEHFVTKTHLGEDDLVSFIDFCEPNLVVNALVGAAGVECSYHSLKFAERLCLANKESLVVAGDLLMPMSRFGGKTKLLPIDSEHGAIFQCLQGEDKPSVKKLIVTCSGGPFRGMNREELRNKTAGVALNHPTWKMGPKITIDSATLFNKGLEVIEAHHLFGVDYDKIEVVVHPQSVVHSAVEFIDGSIKAHLGKTDMKIPIQYALTYPDRKNAPFCDESDFSLAKVASLSFEEPDVETFGALKLCICAGKLGGVIPCAINAANEVANAAFREGKCGFLDIEDCIAHVLENTPFEKVESLEQLKAVDQTAREVASRFLGLVFR